MNLALNRKCVAAQGGVLAAVLLLTPVASAEGQNVNFNPLIGIEQAHTDNVGFAGNTQESDAVTRLRVVLPVERLTRNSTFLFRYAPSFSQFSDFDELDNDGHRVDMEYEKDVKDGSKFGFEIRAERTQLQGTASSLDDADLFLTRRTERELVRANLDYEGVLKGAWGWAGTLGAGSTVFEAISDFDSGMPLVEVEDRDEIRGGLSANRAITRNSKIGVSYAYSQFDLDQSGEEDTHRLLFTGDHEISRTESLSFEIGGFRSEGEAALGMGTVSDTRTGVSAELDYEKEMKRTSLSLSLRRQPTSGGARSGTSTNSSFTVLLAGQAAGHWAWDASARYAKRDPSDPILATIDTASVGGRLEREFGRVLSLVFRANYISQSGGDDPMDDTTALTASVGLTWHPLGRTVVAR